MAGLDGLEILRRVHENYQNPSARDLGEKVYRRDPSVYCDGERYERELDLLFRKRPLIIGHISEVAKSGDFLTAEIAGVPILVVRTDDGELKAFVNVCLHRAATLVTARRGNQKDFICPYHAWTYDLEGGLTSLTDRSCFDGAGLDGAHLKRLPVTERYGLVFVQLEMTENENPELHIDLGEVGCQFEDLGLHDHECFRSEQYELNFNWKLGIDGSLESYHLNFLHPNAAIFSGMVSPFDFYGEHTRFVVGRKAIRKMKAEDLSNEILRENTMISYNLFPNANVTAPHDHIVLQYYMPTSVNTCSFVYKLLVPKGTSETAAKHWEPTWKMGVDIMFEDYEPLTRMQRTFEAGYNRELIFGKYELGLAHFHDACDRAIGLG